MGEPKFYEAGEILRCRDCGELFDFSEGEQRFFAARGFSPPTRCKPCREKHKGDPVTFTRAVSSRDGRRAVAVRVVPPPEKKAP